MSITKQISFSLIPLLVLWTIAEVGLRFAGVARPAVAADPYVGFDGQIPLYVDVEIDGQTERQTAPNKRRFFNEQTFPKVKSPGTRRVFCLGGSTTYGRPYNDETSFCRWLRESLALAAPDTRWEVINAGGISYASYRVAALLEQLLGEEPDLFIVYTGHNEFLEERTYSAVRDQSPWIRRLERALGHSRVYGLVDTAVRAFQARVARDPSSADSDGRARLAAEVETKLESSVGLDAYHRDDALRHDVESHFRQNLHRMADMTEAAKVGLVLVVPADNLSDCSPFKSEPPSPLAAEDADRFAALLESGAQALYRGQAEAARRAFAAAVEMDPRHAHAQYGLGRALRALGDAAGARRAFLRARNEDVCPLRALTSVASAVREVAQERGLPLVDFPEALRQASAAGPEHSPGEDWFLDHVHPTIAGHRLLARHLTDEIDRLGWLPLAPGDLREKIRAQEDQIVSNLDARAHGRALKNLAKVLSWAGKSEDAARAARGALEALGEDEEAYFVLAEFAAERGDSETAVETLQRAIRIDPEWTKAHNNLGVQLMRSGRAEEALDAYNTVLAIDPKHPTAHFNRANCLRELGYLAEAAADYRVTLRRSPEDLEALFNLARVYEEMGDTQAALEALDRLLELDPDDREAARVATRLTRPTRRSS